MAEDDGSGFRVVGSERLVSAAFFELDRLTVAAPDGAHHLRDVVRHPGAVTVIPIDDAGQAVLVRQYRAAIDATMLEAPAGKCDVEGEAPATTAVRELGEEVGLAAGRLVPLAECYNSPGFSDEYSYIFAAFDLTELDGPRPQGPEEHAMTVERIPLSDTEQLIAARTLVDATTIIGLLLARSLVARSG